MGEDKGVDRVRVRDRVMCCFGGDENVMPQMALTVGASRTVGPVHLIRVRVRLGRYGASVLRRILCFSRLAPSTSYFYAFQEWHPAPRRARTCKSGTQHRGCTRVGEKR